MSDWLMRVIKAEAERLIPVAIEDDELRADLRALAEAILAATEADQSRTDTPPPQSPSPAAPTVTAEEAAPSNPATLEAAQADSPRAAEPLRELTLGRAMPPESNPQSVSTATARSKTTHDDLIEIETRCRRKGEAARWVAERLRRLREGNAFPVETPPIEREMVEWADRLTDCFYWMNASEVSEQADLTVLDDVAGCFETVAAALAFVRREMEAHPGNQKVLERSLPIVGEAQSALRAALHRLSRADEPDQLEVFEWLKASAASTMFTSRTSCGPTTPRIRRAGRFC